MDHKGNTRFDVARGLAAIVVFIAHLTQIFVWRFLEPMSWVEISAGIAAREAVLVFFLLSGLLITKSIIMNIKGNGYFEPKDYLLNRIARIYPPFLFALAITVVAVAIIHYLNLPGSHGPLGGVRPRGISFSPGELLKSALLYDGMTDVNGPLWTLYIEVRLYILAMAVAMVGWGRTPIARSIGIVVSGIIVFLSGPLYGFWFFATIWVFGGIMNFKISQRPLAFLVASLCVIVISASLSPIAAGSYLDGNRLGLGLQAASCVLVGYSLLISRRAELPFPEWLRATGDFSYTLYVTHFPILFLGLSISLVIGSSAATAIPAMTSSALVALAVALIAARLLEDTRHNKRLLVSALRKLGNRTATP